jgi:hypothetical protein
MGDEANISLIASQISSSDWLASIHAIVRHQGFMDR